VFAWSDGPVPEGLPVRQVHGWLADDAGRVLVQDRVHEGKFLLPGGKRDLADLDWAHTLIREAAEGGYFQGFRGARSRSAVMLLAAASSSQAWSSSRDSSAMSLRSVLAACCSSLAAVS
jgi:hypothetical protein